jgi:fructose-1,6-bisphosphatase
VELKHPYLERLAHGDLQKVYDGILNVVRDIADHLRFNLSHYVGIDHLNEFGEMQLDTDVHTDDMIFKRLKETGVVYAAASEEIPKMNVLNPEGEYIVTFDPLDGSSVIDANFAVGSIFAIWKRKPGVGEEEHMLGFTGKDVIGAALACYGSRTTMIVYNAIHNRVDEVGLHRRPDKDPKDPAYWQWLDQRKDIKIKPKTNTFSPGNIKAAGINPGYAKCMDHWVKNGYTLRYSGCMAADCFHIFVKGEGIFSSVSAPPKVTPKLRVLYENLPIAFLIVKAGGWASDGYNHLMRITVNEYT